MPFPCGSKAQDKALRPVRQVRLVRVRHHGGIEQRRGFD